MEKIATKPATLSVDDMYDFYIKDKVKSNSSMFFNKGRDLFVSADKEIQILDNQIRNIRANYIDLKDKVGRTNEEELELSEIEISMSNFETRKIELLKQSEKVKKVMTYKLFKEIITLYNTKAGQRIINGEKLNLLNGLGFILGKRVERTFNTKSVNWGETNKLRDEEGNLPINEDGSKKKIYFIDEEWCRIGWKKVKALANITVYAFLPAGGQPGKGFRQAFSKAIKENPIVKLKYEFHPISE